MQDIQKIVNQMHTAIDFGDFEGGRESNLPSNISDCGSQIPPVQLVVSLCPETEY